jgi:hypothetical protein
VKPSGRSPLFAILSALTISAFLAENFLYFPLSVPYMKDLAAGAPLLDMRPGYSPDAAYHLLLDFDLGFDLEHTLSPPSCFVAQQLKLRAADAGRLLGVAVRR